MSRVEWTPLKEDIGVANKESLPWIQLGALQRIASALENLLKIVELLNPDTRRENAEKDKKAEAERERWNEERGRAFAWKNKMLPFAESDGERSALRKVTHIRQDYLGYFNAGDMNVLLATPHIGMVSATRIKAVVDRRNAKKGTPHEEEKPEGN